MSWLGWIFSSSEQAYELHLDDLEKVEVLCERITSSTLIDDKRKSLLELRTLSKNCKLEVGTRSLDIVLEILNLYHHDRDLSILSLDILGNILKCKIAVSNEDEISHISTKDSLSDQFCEILLKNSKNIKILMNLIDNTNFQIRWAVLKLFITLSKSQLAQFQSILTEIHFGITRISDYLNDSREMIRNDCIILLITLTRNNKTVQKILAFENIFEKLFDIINKEGGVDGGIIAHDCLIIMQNILINNATTQKHFRELNLFSKIKPLLDIANLNGSQPIVWPTSRLNIIICFINIIRSFLDPLSSQQSVFTNQNSIANCDIFETLIKLYFNSSIPKTLLIHIVLALSELIRGNEQNQKQFICRASTNYNVKDPFLNILISSINPKNSHALKRSMLYFFQCLLYSDSHARETIILSLVPSSFSEHSSELGRALCAGFFDFDNTLTWISCSCLQHVICNHLESKKELLKVYFIFEDSYANNNTPISLLNRCVQLLKCSTNSFPNKVNILSFLIIWMVDCPECSKTPRPDHLPEFYFDFEFTLLIKKVEVMLNNMLYDQNHAHPKSLDINKILKEKEIEIEDLKKRCVFLENQNSDLKNSLEKSDTSHWETMYSEINLDFQKILNDHQNLLKVLENQEETIKKLTTLLADAESQCNQKPDVSPHHNDMVGNPVTQKIPTDSMPSTYYVPEHQDIAPDQTQCPSFYDTYYYQHNYDQGYNFIHPY
ncbi:hypothetical protein HZS_3682 [Henneguya salminicola]|nr:hypothetical protein HZS_3682 [Henneguya salminicola]